MKAFAAKHKYVGKPDDIRLDKKMKGLFDEAVETKRFTPDFCNKEMFFEFNRELAFFVDVNNLFEAGHIEFVHRDNSYQTVEVVKTEHGMTLCVPAIFNYTEFREVIDAAFGKE